MKLWLVRAGKHGIYESKFLEEGRIYLTWSNLQKDLSEFSTKYDLVEYLEDFYSDEKKNTIPLWIKKSPSSFSQYGSGIRTLSWKSFSRYMSVWMRRSRRSFSLREFGL